MKPLARKLLPFVLLLTAAASALAQPLAPAQGMQARFEQALQAYEIQHFQEAYQGLVRLADEGHAEAARIALLMVRYGQPLYGIECIASAQQRDRWARVTVASR